MAEVVWEMKKQTIDPEELDKHLQEYSTTVFDILDKINRLVSYRGLWDKDTEISFIRQQDDADIYYVLRIKSQTESFLARFEIENLEIMAQKMHLKLRSIGVDKNDNELYIEFSKVGDS
jgi:hypothetical protein